MGIWYNSWFIIKYLGKMVIKKLLNILIIYLFVHSTAAAALQDRFNCEEVAASTLEMPCHKIVDNTNGESQNYNCCLEGCFCFSIANSVIALGTNAELVKISLNIYYSKLIESINSTFPDILETPPKPLS